MEGGKKNREMRGSALLILREVFWGRPGHLPLPSAAAVVDVVIDDGGGGGSGAVSGVLGGGETTASLIRT